MSTGIPLRLVCVVDANLIKVEPGRHGDIATIAAELEKIVARAFENHLRVQELEKENVRLREALVRCDNGLRAVMTFRLLPVPA